MATPKKLQARLSRVRRHREKQDVLLLHDNAQPYSKFHNYRPKEQPFMKNYKKDVITNMAKLNSCEKCETPIPDASGLCFIC
ncbi:hypothetical protein ANN_04459 [Periplaneta americana]|uniref:Uncharacterized protein n=1 Tax=Periplaneta americana TaxID=6978 RepID=A0ABQ8T9U1_PERAM|nr:hypothetical protein ANN_04459 [Periplaneta americana]